MTIKNYLFLLQLILGLAIICLSFELKADVLHWAQFCEQAELQIQNNSQHEVQVWLQKFSPDLISETNFAIPALKTISVPLQKHNSQDRFSLLHFVNKTDLNVQLQCLNQTLPTQNYEGGVYYFRPSDLTENKLWLQNLFSDTNSVQIELLNQKNQLVAEYKISLGSYEQRNFKIPLATSSWSLMRVTAENRISVFNISSNSVEKPIYVQPQTSLQKPEDENASYFLVMTSSKSSLQTADSFIVKITDPHLIQVAREQISTPSLEKIVFGRIQKGHGGFNRNWVKSEKPLWSWSVSEVTNIADLGSTACNGIPQVVENRIDQWLNDPGKICFWSYRIRKELTKEQVERGY